MARKPGTKSVIRWRLVLLLLGVGCFPLGGAPDPYTSELEKSPLPDILELGRNQRAAGEQQERFRIRVPIPQAVGNDIRPAASVHGQAAGEAQTRSPAARPGSRRENLLIGILLVLAGVLSIRQLAPHIVNQLMPGVDSWGLAPATAANGLAAVRAEEQAFSEFAVAFRTGPPAQSGRQPPDADSAAESKPVARFFAEVPKLLGELRELLQKLSATTDVTARQTTLADLQRALRDLKGAAGLPELLPVWQMAAAVEGLVKQLTDKAGNITPSTLRTVAGGVDLLKDLCVPGLRADLLTHPPIRLLAVDDDLISRKAVSMALKKALNPPDLAEDGGAALALAAEFAYDVVFLDVQMPGMDGFEVCTKIHETVLNAKTPVVFVTCQSDFEARVQSTLSGGSDLIGKPFLTFEITVKALALALQRRLPERAPASASSTETQAEARHSVRADPRPPASGPHRETNPFGATSADADHFTALGDPAPNELAQAFLARAAANLGPLRDLIPAMVQTGDENARQEMLADLYLRLNSLMPKVDLAEGPPALRLSAALEGLVKKLLEDPKHGTSSTLLTIATAVDLLQDLCVPGVTPDLDTNPPIRLLAVDDDPVACRAITCALQMAFDKPARADSGEAALALVTERPFDVIFLDAQMPGMDGFEVCAKIHKTVLNAKTPVVFVTGHSDFNARSQASASGGSDFMAKPFLKAEIIVKALAFALRSRLQKHKTAQNVRLTSNEEPLNPENAVQPRMGTDGPDRKQLHENTGSPGR